MARWWLAVLVAPIATGCIIYEERYNHGHDEPCVGCAATHPSDLPPPGTTGGNTVVDPTAVTPTGTTEPAPTGPEATDALALSDIDGEPGEALLSVLAPTEGSDFDLRTLSHLAFERDVEIVDSIRRADEIILLLEVAVDAQPGDVAVTFATDDGAEWFLAEPFEIVGPEKGDDTSGAP